MARVIQEHIKKPLADEVLFGRLKSGGHVLVTVVTDEAGNSNLGFEYPDGPVTPRAEKLPEPRRAKKRRASPRRKPPGGSGGGNPPGFVHAPGMKEKGRGAGPVGVSPAWIAFSASSGPGRSAA